MRLGGVSQKMVARVPRRADGIVEGDEKKEEEGEGKKFGGRGPVLKGLDPAYQPSSNRACDPLRVDRWAVREVCHLPSWHPRVIGSVPEPNRGDGQTEGEVQGCAEERLVRVRTNGSAIPREMDSSRPGAFLADFLVRCPEQFEERLRVTAKNASKSVVGQVAQHTLTLRSWLSISRHYCRIHLLRCGTE